MLKVSPTERRRRIWDKHPLTMSLCRGRPIHYFFLPLYRGVRPSFDILCGFANNDRDEAIIRAAAVESPIIQVGRGREEGSMDGRGKEGE